MGKTKMMVTFCEIGGKIWAAVQVNGVSCSLVDFDHQSLIETIEKIWPEWKDGEQYLIKKGLIKGYR